MSENKNIVIIGASIAGGNLANNLVGKLPADHRILLIDALPYAFWPIAALRAAVVPGWEKRISTPLTTEAVFPAGSPHQVIAPNKVVELREHSIILEHPFEGSTEVPFVKAVIATGASQPAPMRPVPGSSEKEYQDYLASLQKDFEVAKKIVIIGAGTVGVEVAGEIREKYPDTSITLVHNRSHVLSPPTDGEAPKSEPFTYNSPPTALKLSTALESQLKTLNIDLITDDAVVSPSGAVDPAVWDGSFGFQKGLKKVSLRSGKSIEADFVFIGGGNKPNISLVEHADKGAIASGLVAVNEYLQVVSQSPKSILTEDYFAIGDVTSTPGWKTSMAAVASAATAATNILASLNGKALTAFGGPSPVGLFVPLGTIGGAAVMDVPFFGTISVPTFVVKAAKGKGLFVDMFFGRFKGANKPAVPAL